MKNANKICASALKIWISKTVLGGLFLFEIFLIVFVIFFNKNYQYQSEAIFIIPCLLLGLLNLIRGLKYLLKKRKCKPNDLILLSRGYAKFSVFSQVWLIIFYCITIIISIIITALVAALNYLPLFFISLLMFSYPLYGIIICIREFQFKNDVRLYEKKLRNQIISEQQNKEQIDSKYKKEEYIINSIKQYKDLLDKGIITEEEFLAKKENLLKL